MNNPAITVSGRWLRIASIQDEEVQEAPAADEIESTLSEARTRKADLFAFRQQLVDTTPRYDYYYDWDNIAVIATGSFDQWWKSLAQDTRRNVRKAAKSGVILRTVEFDDQLVSGIKGIYDESPIRQGRRFWHYQKDFEAVKRENNTYLDRSEIIGAYYGAELIGFLKLTYVESVATIMQILCKNRHSDKRPANALIAKAVELCEEKRKTHLIYCKYVYGKAENSPLTEFKRRNGFQKLLIPRYYIPLTAKGRLAVKIGLHRSLREVVPQELVLLYLKLRTKYFGRSQSKSEAKSLQLSKQ